ncbi:MAG: hypothetical protein E7147_00485 [Rikenellaceae bacterium]|nr:hypothetical protein [Rikenellaceae bacterium]
MKVKVVIPIYRELTSLERASLQQTSRVLAAYPIEVLYPEGMDIEALVGGVASLECRAVSEEWLGRRNGIAGYNRMCLSEEFYAMYADYDYILICHTDAWIFRDELQEWCERDYDCVAAPWLRRPIYNLPLVKQYMAWRAKRATKPTRQILYGKVGNGGLSLRKVASFMRVCREEKATIDCFNAESHHLYNEDVFWATVPHDFRYPDAMEALHFAIDTHPRYCYKLLGEKLPFGCHSWTKPKFYRFWHKIIEVE